MSTIRKFKREQMKRELGTNKISNEFHKRYGYKPNITKQGLKFIERMKRKVRKSLWKFLRDKKKVNKKEGE